jgi:hypothetical protein
VLLLQMEQSFQMQINMGIAQDGESDEVRGESSSCAVIPTLLGTFTT